jgi:hypothetical protein
VRKKKGRIKRSEIEEGRKQNNGSDRSRVEEQ